jgi:hypothetical protein
VLQIFRTNQIFTTVLLLFYIALLRFTVFLAPFKWTPSGHGIFSEYTYYLVGSQELISQIIAFVLLLVQGFSINLLVINHRLSHENNLFPGVFLVLISCLIPDFLYLSPVLLGNTFFIFSMIELFSIYKNPACADRIFNAGLLVGIASLFYFPFLFFYIFLFAGLTILRAFNIREQLASLSGIFVVYFIAGFGFYWFNQLDFFWEIQFRKNFNFLSFMRDYYAFGEYMKLGVLLFLVLVAIFNSDAYMLKKNIQVQKKISILFWSIGVGVLSAFFQSSLTLEHWLLLAPPLSVFLALTFTSMKPQWAEALHFLLIFGAISVQLATWLL